MRRLVVLLLLGEGEVKRTYPESLCCSNSREPRSEDGELHDEYIDIYVFFCWFVGLGFDWLIDWLFFYPKRRRIKRKKGKQGLIYIHISIRYIPNLSSSHFFSKLRKPQVQIQAPRTTSSLKKWQRWSWIISQPPRKESETPRQCHRVANLPNTYLYIQDDERL